MQPYYKCIKPTKLRVMWDEDYDAWVYDAWASEREFHEGDIVCHPPLPSTEFEEAEYVGEIIELKQNIAELEKELAKATSNVEGWRQRAREAEYVLEEAFQKRKPK